MKKFLLTSAVLVATASMAAADIGERIGIGTHHLGEQTEFNMTINPGANADFSIDNMRLSGLELPDHDLRGSTHLTGEIESWKTAEAFNPGPGDGTITGGSPDLLAATYSDGDGISGSMWTVPTGGDKQAHVRDLPVLYLDGDRTALTDVDKLDRKAFDIATTMHMGAAASPPGTALCALMASTALPESPAALFAAQFQT